ncbi:MAG: chemotaxis protein CheD [Pseudorhodobacter sp.]|nr:chemotaxis protein CheD [Pseudorhodobacter sp.]
MTVVTDGKLTFVIQGTFYVSSHPDATLSTVLGSCISVCLHDPVARIGGMNHFLLATGRGEDSGHIRFGVNAMEKLINEMLKEGASRSRLQAKLFGGGRMSANLSDIGKGNSDFAEGFLQNEGITVLSKSIGGNSARRLVFTPATGHAKMLFVPIGSLEPAEIPSRRPAMPVQAGTVDLF